MDSVLVAPGSFFQFKEWFPPKCRREADLKYPGLDDEELEKKEENEWNCIICVPCHPTPPPPHLSLAQIQKEKHSVKMQKAIIRPSECANATYDGWVWDLERPPVKHQPFTLLNPPSLFPHLSLVSKPYQAPGWNRPKWKTFVIYWGGYTHKCTMAPAVFAI